MKGYARRTSKKGKQDAISIPAQKDRMSQKYGVTNFYVDDGKTASMDEGDYEFDLTEKHLIVKINISKRGDFKDMLFDAKNGDKELLEDGLAVWKWDRFARDLIFQKSVILFLKKCGVTKLKATDDSNDPLGMDVLGVVGQLESNKAKERCILAKKHKFNLGLYFGSRLKLGYKWSKVNIGGKDYKTLIPNPREVQMIKDIFNTSSYRDICNKYNIDPKTYYRIRKDRFYYGMLEFDGETRKGIHEPIITEAEYKKANQG